MVIQIVKFESALSEEEVLATANARADQFRALPGLVHGWIALGRFEVVIAFAVFEWR